MTIVAPSNSDGDFVLNITLDSSENILDNVGSFPYIVEVDADADVPAVIHTDPIVVLENNVLSTDVNSAPFNVTIGESVDSTDLTEDLSILIDIPDFAPGTPFGELDADPDGDVFVWTEDNTEGIYTLAVNVANPTYENTTAVEQRELLNDFIHNGGICLLYTSPSPRD